MMDFQRNFMSLPSRSSTTFTSFFFEIFFKEPFLQFIRLKSRTFHKNLGELLWMGRLEFQSYIPPLPSEMGCVNIVLSYCIMHKSIIASTWNQSKKFAHSSYTERTFGCRHNIFFVPFYVYSKNTMSCEAKETATEGELQSPACLPIPPPEH